METEDSLPHSQVPATCPYPEPARSSPCPYIPLLKIHLINTYINTYIIHKYIQCIHKCQWRTQEFFSGGGVQQIQLRTEDREDGDLGAVAP